MIRQETFDSGELTLSHAQGPPTGPPLVLLHGVLRCWKDFMPLIPALAVRWQLWALDFRGHGASDRTPSRYRVVDYVRDAVALLQRIDEPAVVFGHSLGAMVAAAAAAEVPQRVRALVLEDPPFDTMGQRIKETAFLSLFKGVRQIAREGGNVRQLSQKLADLRLVAPGRDNSIRLGDLRDATSLRFSAGCLTRLDPAVLDPIVAGQWLEGYNRDEILSRIRAPALLLQADASVGGMLSDAEADEIETRIADCTRIRLYSVGHLIHWIETETTLRLLTGFLESITDS